MGLRDLWRHKKKELNEPMEDPPGTTVPTAPVAPRHQAVELGTIQYVNLTPDGRHGDLATALQASAAADKPLFVNFVEWSG